MTELFLHEFIMLLVSYVIEQGTLLEQFLSLEFFDKLIKTLRKGPAGY